MNPAFNLHQATPVLSLSRTTVLALLVTAFLQAPIAFAQPAKAFAKDGDSIRVAAGTRVRIFRAVSGGANPMISYVLAAMDANGKVGDRIVLDPDVVRLDVTALVNVDVTIYNATRGLGNPPQVTFPAKAVPATLTKELSRVTLVNTGRPNNESILVTGTHYIVEKGRFATVIPVFLLGNFRVDPPNDAFRTPTLVSYVPGLLVSGKGISMRQTLLSTAKTGGVRSREITLALEGRVDFLVPGTDGQLVPGFTLDGGGPATLNDNTARQKNWNLHVFHQMLGAMKAATTPRDAGNETQAEYGERVKKAKLQLQVFAAPIPPVGIEAVRKTVPAPAKIDFVVDADSFRLAPQINPKDKK